MRHASWISQIVFAIVVLASVLFMGRCVCQHVAETVMGVMYEADQQMKQLRDVRY